MTESRPINATCPDCRGPLSDVVEDGVHEYRCLVEHRYSALGLLQAHSETQERALWAAVLVLEEAAVLAHETARYLPHLADSLIGDGEHKRRQAERIRAVLDDLRPFRLE